MPTGPPPTWRLPFAEGAWGPSGPQAEIVDPFRYPVDQILLMNHLAFRRGFIIHAAGFVVGGAGFVFPGISGAGKSTLSRLFASHGAGDLVLSDDRIIIREIEGVWRCFGTPWPGDAGFAENVGVPLEALFFPRKATGNLITRLTPSQAARQLFPAVSCPWYDAERAPHVLETCRLLLETTPSFNLSFTPDPAAIATLTRFLQDEVLYHEKGRHTRKV